jgi:hypothetical protein
MQEDIAGIGGVDPGQNLDQGGLARAVFADQRVNFAALDGEIDPIQGQRSGELLGQAVDGEEGRRVVRRCGGVGHGWSCG